MNRKPDTTDDFIPDDDTNIEHLLESMSLKRPSDALDQRIRSLSIRQRPQLFDSWWKIAGAMAATCLVCLFAGFKVGQAFPPNANETADAATSQNATAQTQTMQNDLIDHKQEDLVDIPTEPDHSINAATNENLLGDKENLQIIDAGLFLLDGEFPVRKYIAVKQHRVQFMDPKSGKPVVVKVPYRTSFVTPAHGS